MHVVVKLTIKQLFTFPPAGNLDWNTLVQSWRNRAWHHGGLANDGEAEALRWLEKGRFAEAFEKHKPRETAEQVQEWEDALCKLAEMTGIFCIHLCDYKGHEAKLKWEVVEAVISQLPRNKSVQHHLVGLEDHVNACITKLEKMSGSTRLVCITGMGGVGKTTLAKEIYNHLVGQKKFQAMSFLEIDRTSPSSNEVGLDLLSKLQKELLWDVLHVSDGNQQHYNYWFNKISSRGPILVVLDDTQDKIQLHKLTFNTRILAPGSCIIVASCDRHLLKLITKGCNFYLHEVTPLSPNDSQKLFNLQAFRNEEAPKNFNAIANDVRKACGGLPLALKVVGSSLFDIILDENHLEHIWLEAVDALKGDPNIMNALRWSHNCLLESKKLMFVDIVS